MVRESEPDPAPQASRGGMGPRNSDDLADHGGGSHHVQRSDLDKVRIARFVYSWTDTTAPGTFGYSCKACDVVIRGLPYSDWAADAARKHVELTEHQNATHHRVASGRRIASAVDGVLDLFGIGAQEQE